MTEKESKDILLKDMKEQDARIEAEIQECAVLYRNVEKHTQDLEKRTEEQEIFVRMLQRISGKRGAFDDSETVRKLDSRVLAEERELTKNKKLIHEQQAYYDALRKKDVFALWGQEEEKSALAAICFAFEPGRETSDKIAAKFLSTRSRLPEQTAKYLLEKALSYSESREEADDIAEETDRLLRELFHRMRFPQSGETWQGIEAFLNIRKTKRADARCEALLEAYTKAKEQFAAFEKGYDKNCEEILKEIQDWKKKTGRETRKAVKSAEEWFDAKKAEIDLLVKSRRDEAARIDAALQDLGRFQADLKVCTESGAEPDDAMCVRLKSLAGEKVENVETETLKQKKTQLLGEYDKKYAKKMEEAEEADLKKAEDDQKIAEDAKLAEIERKIREKEEARAKWKERIERLVSFAKKLAVILVILGGSIVGVLFVYAKQFSPERILNNQRFGSAVPPVLGAMIPMQEVIIPDGATEVKLDCKKVKELTMSDGVRILTLYNLKDELALTLSLSEKLEELYIYDSSELTEQGLAAIEIPVSVESLEISGCNNLKNINIANNLDHLEVDLSEDATVNVDGAVSSAYIMGRNLDSLVVNVNGTVLQTLGIRKLSEDTIKSLTVNVNGSVQRLLLCEVGELSLNGNERVGSVEYED